MASLPKACSAKHFGKEIERAYQGDTIYDCGYWLVTYRCRICNNTYTEVED